MKHLISLMHRPGWLGLWIGFSLILAACGPMAAAAPTYPAPAVTAAAPAASPAASPEASIPNTGGPAVQAADNPEFGKILVTSDGLTLYANTVDSPEQLRCIDQACTGFWPPYIVSAQPAAVEGIPGTLGTVTRPDGSLQLTYNQHPLYTFYLDKAPGDAKGNGFTDLGGTWQVTSLGSSPAVNTPAPTSSSGGYQY